MKEIIKKYQKYVKQFDQTDSRILYKFAHSLRVMEKMQMLSENLKQNEEDAYLSSIIGLFHDYGRFYQLENYNTYQDMVFDHGDYGAEELILKQQLHNFVDQKVDEQVVYDAIKNHNKYCIPNDLSEKSKYFSKLIRDADKLDILESTAKGYIEIYEDTLSLSKEVIKEFENHQSIHNENKKTVNDRVLGFYSLVFDLNFPWSYEYLEKHQIIEKIYDKLNNKRLFKPYVSIIQTFIKNKIDENKNERR